MLLRIKKFVVKSINWWSTVNTVYHQSESLCIVVCCMADVLTRPSRERQNFTGWATYPNQSHHHNNLPWNISPTNYSSTPQLTAAEVGSRVDLASYGVVQDNYASLTLDHMCSSDVGSESSYFLNAYYNNLLLQKLSSLLSITIWMYTQQHKQKSVTTFV